MGVAAMVIGIISAILAFIPMCGYIAFVPAVLGFILGVVGVRRSPFDRQALPLVRHDARLFSFFVFLE